MQKQFSIGKRAVLALFLIILSSCSCFSWFCNICSPWCCEGNCAWDPCFSSQRIYLSPANKYSGLEMELMNFRGEIRMYLNVCGPEIPPYPDDPSKAEIFLNFRDHHYRTLAERLRGGQRLLIPECVRDEIIWYLFQCQPVFLQVGRYSTDLPPDRFAEIWHRMHRVN